MTHEELRAQDAEVHRRVFGEIPEFDPVMRTLDGPVRYHLPHYSTDIASAHEIVAKWHGDVLVRRQNGFWKCTFFEPSREYEEWAETEPLAICKAALKAFAPQL